MNVRIEAQDNGDGTMRCELVIIGDDGTEAHMPAVVEQPELDELLPLLAGRRQFVVEVAAPLLRSVSIETGGVTSVRSAADYEPGEYRLSTRGPGD